MNEAERLNQRLQKEARELLGLIDLENILSKYGKVFMGGSFTYGTMVDEDIDITVWFPPSTFDSVVLRKRLTAEILSFPELDGMEICDREKYPSENNPAGVWIGPRIWFKGARWNIDIWLVREHTKGIIPENDLHKRMMTINDDQRKLMLNIKHQALKAGIKKKTTTSADIYRAVLDDGVKSFEEYLDTRQVM